MIDTPGVGGQTISRATHGMERPLHPVGGLHGKRYHIKVDGRRVMPEDLESWHDLIDTDNLPTE